MFKLLGPDTGFDSIGEFTTAKAMAKFLDRLNSNGKLTKTILYNLNPCANEVIATMLGNFQDGTVAGKIQFGSGWWFLDQKDGMEKQMNALSVQTGLMPIAMNRARSTILVTSTPRIV
jgi:glucuronate isomerase